MNNNKFGGLAGLLMTAALYFNPTPAAAQDYERAPTTQADTIDSYDDSPHADALRARNLRERLQTLLSDERTGTIVPGAFGDPSYSGLFQLSDFQVSEIYEDRICFMQRGPESGGTETFRGRESSPFENNSTFSNLYKEFTTLGHYMGDSAIDAQINVALLNLHTDLVNEMYLGGEAVARPSDWELTWRNGELMGIQVVRERLVPLRRAVHAHARTLPVSDERRRPLLRAGVFSDGRHIYLTTGPFELCLDQRVLLRRESVREVVREVIVEVPVEGEPAPATPAPTNCIDETLDALRRLERGQGNIRDDTREHDARILARLEANSAHDEGQSADHISVVGGFGHQWISVNEINNGGNYSYLSDGTGGRARVHFDGGDIIFSLMGGAYTGSATIEGVAHGTPFSGEASGLDVLGYANLVYLPWSIGSDLRIGVGADLSFNLRDLHNMVYQIAGEEVRDDNITEIQGALTPGIMLAYHGDIAVVEAFLGLGPAFEQRTDNSETNGNGQLTARLLTAFRAGDNFIPYVQLNGGVNFDEQFMNARAGGEAGVIVQFDNFIIGPAGSIDYRYAVGEGFTRESIDYQVYLFTGFRTGAHSNQE